MCAWRRWIWPGITTTALLTVLGFWFRPEWAVPPFWQLLPIAVLVGLAVGWHAAGPRRG